MESENRKSKIKNRKSKIEIRNIDQIDHQIDHQIDQIDHPINDPPINDHPINDHPINDHLILIEIEIDHPIDHLKKDPLGPMEAMPTCLSTPPKKCVPSRRRRGQS